VSESSPAGAVPGAVDLADGLLCALVLGAGTAARVAPAGDGHEALVATEAGTVALSLSRPLGRAVVVRLALVAGLDPWGPSSAVARLRVRAGEAQGEFAVVVEPSGTGLAIDLRRLAAPASARSGRAAMPATPVSGTPAPAPGAAPGAAPGPPPSGVPPADERLRIGPYLVESELGRGAMGIVYRARRDGQGPAVAVKLLKPAIASDPSMTARFAREGRAAALVNHPGVVGVTDFGQLPDGQAYLVMELVEGTTLEEALAAQGAMPPAEAVRLLIRILSALEAAHVRGVVHRDLKPSNVFLVPGGQVKIADFGAAHVEDPRRSGRLTDADLVLGSPAYMAPEQALGHEADDRADLYSLGCVLYRMLSGHPPFEARTLLEVLRRQIEDTAAPVRSPHGALPVVLVEAVERALRKEPEERFRSAGEMRSVLEQALVRLIGGDRREGRK
jgi:serine/threonine-protein kinase